MSDSILRQGSWWHQRVDGVWLRYDQSSGTWEEQTAPPPPPLPHEATEQVMPHWTAPYQSPEGVARALVFLLGLGILIDVVAIISGVAEYSLLGRVQSGELVSNAEATASDARQATIGIAQILLFLVTVVVWIVWFHRAYKNLGAFRTERLRFKPGWAIGAWFVPFLNLVRPFQIATDIWRASAPDPEVATGQWTHLKTPALLGWWWALWLLSNVIGQFGGSGSFEDASVDDLRTSSLAFILSDAVTIVATILAIVVVRGITKRQEERAAAETAPATVAS